MTKGASNWSKWFSVNDLLAALSVGIVIVTLGAAFGVLAGRGAFAGMLSTSLIVLVTTVFGGGRFGVSSPTGPMVAALGVVQLAAVGWLKNNGADLGGSFSADQIVNLIIVTAGVMLFLMAVLKVYKLLKFVPNLVVSGFVNGIAVLIAMIQLKAFSDVNDIAVLMVTFGLALLFCKLNDRTDHPAWNLVFSSFFVILVMSFFAWISGIELSYVSVDGMNFDFGGGVLVGGLNWDLMKFVLPLAFELSLIALLDTMLTAVIMDKKTKTETKMFREISGQSVATGLIGLFGGVPGAQSTAPSIMLFKEGAKGRFVKWLLVMVCVVMTFVLVDLISYVPTAVLGGVVLKVAFDIADLTSFRAVWKHDVRDRFGQYLVIVGTLLATVFISLNAAVVGFTVLFIVWNRFAPKSWRFKDLIAIEESEGMVDEL